MSCEKRKEEEEDMCTRLNGSITVLLALAIAAQHGPGYAGTLPAISK